MRFFPLLEGAPALGEGQLGKGLSYRAVWESSLWLPKGLVPRDGA